jgi:peptidoglycan/xylan/chitin deacetylase (PgdA/CDA1 family)
MFGMGVAGEFAWPEGATAAISLTFDGGHPEHWELVAPILSEHEIRATFFVTVPSILENPDQWRRVVQAGHEIGSHSHYGITHDGSLPGWTLEMVKDDLRMTDKGLAEILECPVTSFARAGHLSTTGDGDYRNALGNYFSGIRSVETGVNEAHDVDLYDVKSFLWSDMTGPIESCLPHDSQWSVPVFDRFFGLENMAAEDDLRVLIGHMKRRKDVWIAPFAEVVAHIKAARGPVATI